jgi:RNA polymerase subunit RPABC4/transcription elongation factor Spt4
MTHSSEAVNEKNFVSKKCPDCYEYMPLEVKKCPSCKTRVGKIGSHGMAERQTNWTGYLVCILLWLFLAAYVKWAFF